MSTVDYEQAAGTINASRIWSRIDQSSSEACWVFTGYRNRQGYGRVAVKIDGAWKSISVHRLVYFMVVGPVPADLALDHLCFNPAHLEPVTVAENNRRRAVAHAHPEGQCSRGHETTAGRVCLLCNKLKYAERVARRRVTTVSADDPRHGTEGGYQYMGCRCQPCRDANAAKQRERRSDPACMARQRELNRASYARQRVAA